MLYKLLVVLHESVVDCEELLRLIQSPTFGASYHICIDRLGTVTYLVPPGEKAFAAAHSRFINVEGVTEEIDGSVDDFAYHIALETPFDGRLEDELSHSGYTDAQYKSLAWVISKTGVDNNRITTHKEVSLGGSKDPRSFNLTKLYDKLDLYKREKVFDFGYGIF